MNIIGNLIGVTRGLGFPSSVIAAFFTSSPAFSTDGTDSLDKTVRQQTGREIKQPKALEFNGTNQDLRVSLVGVSTDFTICGWINTEVSSMRFAHNESFQIYPKNTSGFLSFFDGTAVRELGAEGNIADGNWHFIGIKVTDGSVYGKVDGGNFISMGAVSVSSTWITTFIASNAFSYWAGSIRDWRRYNTPLTDEDAEKIRLQQSITTLPVNQYLFEEEAGSIAIDSGTAKQNGTIVNYADAMRVDADFTKMKSQANEVGFTISDGSTYYYNDDDTGLITSGVIIPKLAGENKAAAYLAGGAQADLQFTGRVPYNFDIDNGIYFQGNGTNRTITIGNTGVSATSVSVWIKQSVDNQVLFALQSSTATAVSVSAGVLTFGASLTASNITVDGVSKTASEAGALLNDNNWHKLEFDLTSIAASNLILFGDGTNFGNVGMSDFKINNTDVQVPLNDKPLSSVATSIDGVESYKTVTNSNAAQWQNDTTGQLPVRNLIEGYSLYEHSTEPDAFIPYFDDLPYAGTPPTGYTKTSDHPAITGFNGCEAEFKAPRVYDLWQADSGNFLYDGSDVPQDISYADFVAQSGDVNDLGNITYNVNEANRTITNLKIKELVNRPTMVIQVDATSDLTQEIRLDDTAFIDWGDGTALEQANGINVLTQHTYAVAGNYSMKIYGTFTDFRSFDNAFSFDLSQLPSILTVFFCTGQNTISGDLADLPTGLDYFFITGLNTISGDLSGLPSSLTFFICQGKNTVSGNLAGLPSSLTFFRCLGQNTISGDLADLPTGLDYCRIIGNSNLSFTGTWDCANAYRYLEYTRGLTTTEVDNLLISMVADITTAVSEKVIKLDGSNGARTSASDAAVTYLQGLGFTVTTN